MLDFLSQLSKALGDEVEDCLIDFVVGLIHKIQLIITSFSWLGSGFPLHMFQRLDSKISFPFLSSYLISTGNLIYDFTWRINIREINNELVECCFLILNYLCWSSSQISFELLFNLVGIIDKIFCEILDEHEGRVEILTVGNRIRVVISILRCNSIVISNCSLTLPSNWSKVFDSLKSFRLLV